MGIITTLLNNELFIALLYVVGALALSEIIHIFLKVYVRKLTKKTRTDIDDIVLGIVTRPVYVFIVFIGAYLGVKTISTLTNYFVWVDRIFFVGAVLLISLILTKVLSVFVPRGLKVHKKFEKTPKLISKILNTIIYAIALIIIMDYFNIEITPLIATLGVGGLAVGLALQKTLSNFFSGLYILSDKYIRVGDFVEIDNNLSGHVEDIGWRSTTIKKLPNTLVVIPNSVLAESIIVNNSLPEHEMSLVVKCGVSYESDLDKVEKATIDVAKKIQKKMDGAVSDFEPFIRYNNFGDSNIDFSIILRIKTFTDKYLITHEFIKALKKRYDKEKIDISWPVMKMYKGK